MATFDDLQNATVVMGRPGLVAGTGIEPGEKASIFDRLLALETLPPALGDLADVDTTGVGDGDTIVRQGGTWVAGSPVGTLDSVQDHSGATVRENVPVIQARGGLTAVPLGSLSVAIQAIVGTGPGTLAAGDHEHNWILTRSFPYSAPGVISGGARSLVSGSVPLNTFTDHTVFVVLDGDLRGQVNAGRVTVSLGIGADIKARNRPTRTVGGVDRSFGNFWYFKQVVAGPSSVTVSASVAYTDGDPTYLEGGELIAFAIPRR